MNFSKILLAVTIFIMAVMASGCPARQTAPKETGDNPAADQSAGLDVDSEKPAMEFQGDEGTKLNSGDGTTTTVAGGTGSTEGALPESWPADLPVMDGSSIQNKLETTSG